MGLDSEFKDKLSLLLKEIENQPPPKSLIIKLLSS